MDRIIKVETNASKSFKLDQTIVEFGLVTLDKDYDKAVKIAHDNINKVINTLINIGFKEEDIKTSSFHISRKEQTIIDPYNIPTKEFLGFECEQKLKIKFDISDDLLGRIIYEMSKLDVNPSINVTHTLKDVEEAQEQLLVLGMNKALREALVIAGTSNLLLDEIISVELPTNYIDPRRMFSVNLADTLMVSNDNKYNFSIIPEDVILSREVRVIWSIRDNV